MLLSYPPELPISDLKNTIVEAIDAHRVLIIAGDTGSGKTTQIPKMCLEAGRGSNRLIGCTQPRRIAAVSVARRVAEEIRDDESVGYKIRFRDRTSGKTRIKFMTDGVLLAETRRDPALKQYDTIIIDEAHERSLNIDFLLGYLKTLLARRPELKVIIASATIDTEKFSTHFDNAPIINVSGRNFPIATRYLDHEEPDFLDSESYVDLAVQEGINLQEHFPPGDILIFMPTERDILDTVDMLLHKLTGQAEVMPLFGRLQAADQRRIFLPSGKTKIIVATNVAETSITVPGIRYVIDTGLARIARYNPRSRTTSLRIEKISRASCDQRAGRCGRTGPGTCIRLYTEEDYLTRPEYTQPEIQRSNLAEVILQMVNLRLGNPREFPFLDPPSVNSIRDGYKVLFELGAISAENKLTRRGQIMAGLPLDPSISRIIIEGAELGALREIKIIAAGLSIQDPRIRPADKEDKADEKHRLFVDKRSDFLGLLNIWEGYQATAEKVRSQSKLRKFCAGHYLSWQRMREWLDIHDQITELTRHIRKFRDNTQPASYEAVHQALLSGFIRNIGQKKEKNYYTVVGNREVMIFPGSALFNRGGQWILASSFMETNRLYAMQVGNIDVRWLERTGGDLCRRSWSDPHWEKKAGRVVALEKVTLFGLVIVAGRRVNFGRINEAKAREAREIFIRQALIGEELGTGFAFFRHNIALMKHYREMEDRLRRRDIVFDETALYDFYDKRLGLVYDRFTLKNWIRKHGNDEFLQMTEQDLCRAVPDQDELYRFPGTLRSKQRSFPLSYRFEPGHEADGVTVDIHMSELNSINPGLFEWLVPGLLREKILALLKYLPKKIRRQLIPLPETVDNLMDSLDLFEGSLYTSLEKAIGKQFQVKILRTDWHPEKLPNHLRMRYRLLDDQGRILAISRSLQEMLDRSISGPSAPAGVKKDQVPPVKNITVWDFAKAPRPVMSGQLGRTGSSLLYPALTVNEEARCIDLHFIPDEQESRESSRQGLLYLYALQFPTQIKSLARECKGALTAHSASWLSLGLPARAADIQQMLLDFILLDIFEIRTADLPDRKKFESTVARVKKQGLVRSGLDRLHHIIRLLGLRRSINSVIAEGLRRKDPGEAKFREFADHLHILLPQTFLTDRNYYDLTETERYLKALEIRIERAAYSPAKDSQKAEQVSKAVKRLAGLPDRLPTADECRRILDEYGRMVEEFRVSVFAPELGTAIPVSEKRLQKKWEEVENACLRVE
ncbi:MAG: ATP-dependent RNA helicase HrpA [Desulfobulbaceae bacterium]|nr:ATP-dependent RNA helicase HrpA [Desulfobulbaceae bacterium]